MKNFDKIEKLFKLQFMFYANKYVTVKDISKRLDVSQRTAYRYLEELMLCIPIYKSNVHKDSYKLDQNSKLEATFFTKDELSLIIQILSDFKQKTHSIPMATILDKYNSLKSAKDIKLDLSTLIIDNSSWGNVNTINPTLTLIQECIDKRKSMSIEYIDRSAKHTIRTIDPHVLLLKKDTWYTYAYCHSNGDLRLFKVSRIFNAEETDKSFIRKDIANVSDITKYWYQSLTTEEIQFEFDKSIQGDIEEWLGFGITKEKDGVLTATVNLPLNDEIVNKVLSFGNKIKVIKPEKLINDIKDRIKTVSDLYK